MEVLGAEMRCNLKAFEESRNRCNCSAQDCLWHPAGLLSLWYSDTFDLLSEYDCESISVSTNNGSLIAEINEIQSKCHHVYKDGICTICLMERDKK